MRPLASRAWFTQSNARSIFRGATTKRKDRQGNQLQEAQRQTLNLRAGPLNCQCRGSNLRPTQNPSAARRLHFRLQAESARQ